MKINKINIDNVIKQALKGDQSCYKTVYVQYSKYVLTICRRYQVHPSNQKDLLQDIFCHAFLNLGKYDSSKGKFQFWLRKLSINIILKSKEKDKKNILNYTTNYENYHMVQDQITEFSDEEIFKILRAMPEKFSTVFNLFVIDGYTSKEISQKLNMNEGTIRSYVSRGRQWAIKAIKKSHLKIHKCKSI